METERYNASFIRLAPNMPGVLYAPSTSSDKSRISVIAIHTGSDYLDHPIGPELAARGYTVLCANVSNRYGSLALKIKEVGFSMDYLRSRPGVEKVILMGHSGGGTLMSAYQNIAENGVQTFQGDEKLVKCPDFLAGLTPADGFMSLDSNWGNGAMRLLSIDPAVIDERGGVFIDEELNMFNPANGFDPDGSTYPDDFLMKFFNAQADRNNRLIDFALERLSVIDAGKGFYADDEPMIMPGSMQIGFNNKLFPQDIRFLSRSRGEWPLIHRDGSATTGVVHTVRKPKNGAPLTGSFVRGALNTTVKTFLVTHAVRALDGYGYDEAEVRGIDWNSSYNCTCGNVAGVTAPMLVLGMTANWEFAAAEMIYNNSGSSDKSLAYIEGADHDFRTAKSCERYEGEFGDTIKTTFDYVDKWLAAPGRFV